MDFSARNNDGLAKRKIGRISALSLMVLVFWFGILQNPAHAYPTLQLDILGGTFDWQTETVTASAESFVLYALIIPDSKNTLTDTYFISAALTPESGPTDVDAGSFTFNGATIDVSDDMTYGVPPLEVNLALQGFDAGDLAKHDIFPTFFSEFGFQFNPANRATGYNTQDDTGVGPILNPDGSMYFAAFAFDVSGLAPGYGLHFDLYNTKVKSGDVDVTQFAPFSHDAQTRKVPEPASLILVGVGLLSLQLFRIWKAEKTS